MQFLRLEVGGPDTIHPSDQTLLVPFTFPSPVTRVHCMLQAVYFRFTGDDEHLRTTGIEPRVEFDSFASSTGGQIRVHLKWTHDHGFLLDDHLSTFWARLLVIGE